MDPTVTIVGHQKSYLKWCAALFLVSFPLWRLEWDISNTSIRDVPVDPSQGMNISADISNAVENHPDNITSIVTFYNSTHNPNVRSDNNNISSDSTTGIVTAIATHNTNNMPHDASAQENNYSSDMPFYHGLWDFETHSIHIPNKRPGDKITSLEILQNVLKEDETQNGSTNRSCLIADVERAEELVRSGLATDLPRPILNVGMPKCGSSTLRDFFTCAGLNDRHGQDGLCIANAIKRGEPPISGCASTRGKDSLTQIDINKPTRGQKPEGNCWFPQVSFLDEIHREFPNATFVMNFRPVDDWIESARSWAHMTRRWSLCRIPGKVKAGKFMTQEEIRNWMCGHVKHVREFVKQYSSHKLIELDLYDTERSARIMSSLFNTNETCWGWSNMKLNHTN